MTLVELLITITILTIIASAVVFASFQATTAARISNTRSRVSALNTLLMEKYDEFQTRRVDVPDTGGSGPGNWQVQAVRRLRLMRVLMRMELPDRWSDVTFESVASRLPTQSGDLSGYREQPFSTPLTRTALSRAYLRRYDSLRTTDPDVIEANQGAECLYMIVTLATADGEALSLFNANDVGDVDGDGAPEFHDAWGRPIHYLLAAPGFTTESGIQSRDPVNDHDPFDPYRVDTAAFRLMPLIYSAGPDGDPDLAPQKDVHPLVDPTHLFYYQLPALTIGLPITDDPENPIVDDDGDNWLDNIHNHEQSVSN